MYSTDDIFTNAAEKVCAYVKDVEGVIAHLYANCQRESHVSNIFRDSMETDSGDTIEHMENDDDIGRALMYTNIQ
jgi:hypothetical protein